MTTPQTYYFDFSKKGQDLLGKRDIPVLKNDQAIKESILNLLSTEIGSRPMNPAYGVDLDKFLFEIIDDITADLITFEITSSIQIYEPRAENVVVTVIPTEDELSYEVIIKFSVSYTNASETLKLDFSKIR